MKLSYSDRAERNLDDILAWVRMDRPIAAAHLLERIRLSCDQLRRHPYIGRNGAVPGTRELVVRNSPFIIVYTVDEAASTVTIVNIFHGARQRRGQD